MASEDTFIEPLLRPQPNRFVIFPIEHHDIWKMYKQQFASFWKPEEINFADDINDFNEKLNDGERYFISNILAYFAASDGLVGENLVENFYSEIEIPESRFVYGFQIMMENVHSNCYSLFIETLITDPKEKHRLFNSIETIPSIKKKADWAKKWMNKNKYDSLPECIRTAIFIANEEVSKSDRYSDSIEDILKARELITTKSASFAERLVAFSIVEGVFFSGSFCAIFWLKERNILPAICLSNKFIAKDESAHTDYAVMLYSKLERKLDTKTIHAIMIEAVDIEKEFITESFSCDLIGMNPILMRQYIEFVADRLTQQLGYPKIYNSTNPFDFMNNISMEVKENFFEGRVTNYQQAGVMESLVDKPKSTKKIGTLELDDDF